MLYALMINGNMIRTINGRDVNTTPSNKEKVASKVSSEEAKSFIVNKDQTIDDLVVEKENEYKEDVNEYLSNLDNYDKQLTDYSKDINLNTLEMKPLYEGIIISPFVVNPFQQIKKVDGLIVDLGGKAPIYKSREDGAMHEEDPFIKVGKVMEIGTKCTYTKVGDIVMWRKPSETVIPFYRKGFVLVNEHSLIAIFNSGLTERFNNNDK